MTVRLIAVKGQSFQCLRVFGKDRISALSFFNEQALDGNPKILAESPAQQAFTLLNLLAEPEDRVALRCWCGFGTSSLQSGSWARLRNHCESTGESPKVALERLASGAIRISHAAELVSKYQELQRKLTDLAGLVGPHLRDSLFPPSESWTEPFQTLASTIEGVDFGPKKLRDVLTSGITQPELPTEGDYVRVMSLHKSKGLTADLVVVVGCIEGLIPFIDSSLSLAAQNSALEEQRRLFYVAITRTKQILLLSSVTRLPRDLAFRIGARVIGGNPTHAKTISSRFLSQLGTSSPRPVVGSTILR